MKNRPSPQKLTQKQLTPFHVALFYAIFAALWIISSGHVITLAVDDASLQAHIEQIKGLAFVAVTSCLLYLLLKGWQKSLIDPEPMLNSSTGIFSKSWIALLFSILILIVPMFGGSIALMYEQTIEREAFANLEAITKLKSEQIENWMNERQNNGLILTANPEFIERVDKLINQPNQSSRDSLQNRFNLIRAIHGYDNVMLLDEQGQLLLNSGEDIGMTAASKHLLAQLQTNKKSQTGDIYLDEQGNSRLYWTAPIAIGSNANQRKIATLVFGVRPQQFLFPLIQTWPTSSPSAETLLVKRDGESSLFLNTLRHRDKTAFTLRSPLNNLSSPSVKAIFAGEQPGIAKGIDYRNIEVLAAFRPVKNTDWHLVAKIDRHEVLAPLRELVFWVTLVAFIAIIAISIALIMLWRQQQKAQAIALEAQKIQAERELEIADASLKESKNRNQALIDSALDGIIAIEGNGRIISWSPQATQIFGYSVEQALGEDVAELIVPLQYRQRHKQGIARFITTGIPTIIDTRIEIQGMRADGSEFPMELSISAMKQENGYFFCAYVRDISERKKMEDALVASEQEFRLLAEAMPQIVWVTRADGWNIYFNRQWVDYTGQSLEESYGHGWNKPFHPEDQQRAWEAWQNAVNHNAAYSLECRLRRADGIYRWWLIRGVPVLDQEGKICKWFGTCTDIHEIKETESALRMSEKRLASAMQWSHTGGWDLNLTDHSATRTLEHDRIFGYESLLPEWSYETFIEHVLPEDRAEVDRRFQHAIATQTEWNFECRIRRKDGAIRWIWATGGYIVNGEDQARNMTGIVQDITERKQAENELRIAATAFESHEAMLITDANQVILKVNQAFTRITGYSAEEAIGKTPNILKSDKQNPQFYTSMWEKLTREKFWQGELWNRRKNGELYPEWLTISAVTDASGQICNYVAVFADITAIKKSEATIHNLAFYDPVTKLPNRRLLIERLQQALNSSFRHLNYGAILFIDLDNFKELNDIKGYEVGDQLLVEVAKRLKLCTRTNDTIACLGGDDFVAVLEDLSTDAEQAAIQAENIAEKIRIAISQPFNLQQLQYHNASSIGISLFSNHETSVDDLLKHADTAMYQAKQSGRNAIRFFDPATHAAMEARIALEADLRLALSSNQFQLYYQMQVDSSRKIHGAEVLIRWQHPVRGLVPPAQFIPIVEANGLVVPIGRWVLETACAQIKRWESDNRTRHLQLAVNVSALQFRQSDFVDQVRAVLEKTGIKAGNLKLELTETVVLENINDTIDKIQTLKKLGVHFSMDDFGTGYSSLAYLSKLPLDQLKIDQSFVRNIDVKASDTVIVQTIIGMAKNLGMEIIAEGVETEQQRDFLERNGCNHYQGYLFSKPVPLDAFEQLLRTV